MNTATKSDIKITLKMSGKNSGRSTRYHVQKITGAVTVDYNHPTENAELVLRAGDRITEDVATLLSEAHDVTVLA